MHGQCLLYFKCHNFSILRTQIILLSIYALSLLTCVLIDVSPMDHKPYKGKVEGQ